MKKLSILLKWLIASFIFIVATELILIFGRVFRILFDLANPSKKILNIDFTEHLSDSTYSILGIIISFVFIYLLFHLIRFFSAIKEFSQKEIFTNKNIRWLNSAGKAIFLVTFFLIFFELSNAVHIFGENVGHSFKLNILEGKSSQHIGDRSSYHIGYSIGYSLGYFTGILYKWMPLLILGVLIRIVSELLKAGTFMRQENDLTI